MRRFLAAAGLALGLVVWPSGAGASGDSGCWARWTLVAPTFDCANRIVIGPGNDTRVNLMLLLRDRAGLDGQSLAYPGPRWLTYDYGDTFFDWGGLSVALYPLPAVDAEPAEFAGTRCQSVKAGGAQFLAAAGRNRRIGEADRALLAAGREAVLGLCRTGASFADYEVRPSANDLGLPDRFASPEAGEFGTYLQGAAAFYLGDWDAARGHFVALRAAKDPWVRETALYMSARSELGAANAAALDEWGFFDPAKADRAVAGRAGRGFAAYVEAYPQGLYTASAAGLVRRAEWLGGASVPQGAGYVRALAAADPADPATAALLDEIDDKFLFADGAAEAIDGPWLLATHDLMRMRQAGAEFASAEEYERHGLPLLTADELAAQQAAFAGQPQLYAFLQANHAFYVAHDYRAVLRLLPDDARRPAYTPLQFSAQVLRGMALAELGDRNEAGFWQELLGGAKGLYQRPTVELGLALNWERSSQVAQVFAAGSPIGDARIRAILLEHSAGPEILRAVAADAGRPRSERDLAAYVLLYKQLSRAAYASAARDLAQVRADAPLESYSDETQQQQTPLGLYLRGAFSDAYACPDLRETVARLASNPRDVNGRLCLGDFYRLNGFDTSYLDLAPGEGELGSFAAYPGAPIPRSALYADIIGEPGVRREDRAYALYRAIYCYAPSRNNTCGGEEVPEAQRQAWFRRLKGEFADTRWGREIEYYW